jgi:uncharacterized protein
LHPNEPNREENITVELTQLPANFTGVSRLFPLPNLVMFPHVMQPLHIFEPRYVEMVEEAIRTDQLLAMSILQPGWEHEYPGRPAVFSTVCLGKIATHAKTDDGNYNILLLGLKRAQIRRELPPLRSFRQAELELLEDHYSSASSQRREKLHGDLLDAFRGFIQRKSPIQEQFDQILTSSQIPLGMLTDMVSFTIELPMASKIHLLGETNVDNRAAYLLEGLCGLKSPSSGVFERVFPPAFSHN